MAMNGINNTLNVIASALTAENTRMNTIASNLANANSVGASDNETYRAKHPVFATIMSEVAGLNESEQAIGGVRIDSIITDDKPLKKQFDPNNPLADKDGYIHLSDVDPIQEMSDMIDSSRHYQALVEVANAEKGLALQTVRALND